MKAVNLKMIVVLIITVVTAGLLLTACNSKTESKTEEISEKNEFNPNIDISTETVSETEIKTTIKTNFPENTSLTISASRDYRRKKSNERYAIDLYYSFNSIVKDGQISFTFNPLDKSWIDEYNALRKQNGQFDKTLTEIDMKSIKDSIEISVLYTPKGKQPENVKAIIGVDGENLSGINVETTRQGFKTYRMSKVIYSKFGN
jgi:ABC-type oligopeptide transport system substrate-binding subunit